MAKILVKPDCGNAPKKELIRDFEIAFTEKDPQLILDVLDEKITWILLGDRMIIGKAEAEKELEEMLDGSITQMTIDSIITHGDEGSANGVMKFADGTTFAFCDVFVFSNHAKDAKIKKLTSFVIDISQ